MHFSHEHNLVTWHSLRTGQHRLGLINWHLQLSSLSRWEVESNVARVILLQLVTVSPLKSLRFTIRFHRCQVASLLWSWQSVEVCMFNTHVAVLWDIGLVEGSYFLRQSYYFDQQLYLRQRAIILQLDFTNVNLCTSLPHLQYYVEVTALDCHTVVLRDIWLGEVLMLWPSVYI